jgi:hypothetical protein
MERLPKRIGMGRGGVTLLVVRTLVGQAAAQTSVAPPGMTGWWPGDGHPNEIVGGRNARLSAVTIGPGFMGEAFTLDG